MARPTMTAEAFEVLQPRLSHLTLSTIEITREVLVEGKSQSEVARRHGITRQSVSDMVARVRAAAKENEIRWRKVEPCTTAEMAEQVHNKEAETRELPPREKKIADYFAKHTTSVT